MDSQNTNFSEKGSYSIVAKKEGFQESEPLNLTVYLVETYVVGYEGNGSNEVAKLWKNGVAQNLTDGSNNAVAKSVYVSGKDRKSTRLNSSHVKISYAVFCLKKKNTNKRYTH